ncbi:MAG: hypothetical protein ABH951_02955 [Patescibacteria group bacterium]
MSPFTPTEKALLKKLNTPAKVQDFLNKLRFNFEEPARNAFSIADAGGDGKHTIKSPVRVLREKNAHCMEGAILGAYILSLHGQKPLILHLQTTKDDFDHIITLFKENNLWGALSKTNHGVLRYREAVYKNIRELVMSYFHEYYDDNGKKTLRKYSKPLDLNVFEKGWELEEKDLWGIDHELDVIKHYDIVSGNKNKKIYKNLRKADDIELEMTGIIEWEARKN